jgi:hypothetical protein
VFSENQDSEIPTLCNGIKEILPVFFKIFRLTWIEFDIGLQNHGTDKEFQ